MRHKMVFLADHRQAEEGAEQDAGMSSSNFLMLTHPQLMHQRLHIFIQRFLSKKVIQSILTRPSLSHLRPRNRLPRPDAFDEFRAIMLNFDLVSIHKATPDIISTESVPAVLSSDDHHTSDPLSYLSSFYPFAHEEARAMISEYMASELKGFSVHVKKVQSRYSPLIQLFGKVRSLPSHVGKKNVMVLISRLKKAGRDSKLPQDPTLAILDFSGRNEVVITFKNINAQNTCRSFNGRWKVIPLLSLNHFIRVLSLAQKTDYLPHVHQLAHGRLNAWPFPSCFSSQASNHGLNPVQERIVRTFPEALPGIYALHGSMDTGKSHTLVNLIFSLVARGERVLVSASSANAINVIAQSMMVAFRFLPMLIVGLKREYDKCLFPLLLSNSKKSATIVIESHLQALEIFHLDSLLAVSEGVSVNVEDISSLIDECDDVFRVLAVLSDEEEQANCVEEYITCLEQYLFVLLAYSSGGSAHIFNEASVIEEYRKAVAYLNTIKELNHQIDDKRLLSSSSMVCFSTLMSTQESVLFDAAVFDTLIIDDAHNAIECESLLPFLHLHDQSKVLLVGDLHQPKPMLQSTVAMQKGFHQSLFSRMIEDCDQSFEVLTTRYS